MSRDALNLADITVVCLSFLFLSLMMSRNALNPADIIGHSELVFLPTVTSSTVWLLHVLTITCLLTYLVGTDWPFRVDVPLNTQSISLVMH